MVPILEFVLGIAVLVYSAEKLIGYLVGVACSSAGRSPSTTTS